MVRKSIHVADCHIMWYFYSQIGNFSSERITVKKGDRPEVLVFESDAVATDFEVRNDSLIIRTYAPLSGGIAYKSDTTVYGYTVVVDTTASIQDFQNRPNWRLE